MISIVRLLLVVISLLSLYSKAFKQKIITNELVLDSDPLLQNGDIDDILLFCINPPNNDFNPLYWFHQIDIDIKVPSSYLSIFSVKGLSEDDFHNIGEDIIKSILKTDKGNEGSFKEKVVNLVSISSENFLRDILSACPSPLLSQSNEHCIMSFSPFKKACIVVNNHKQINTSVEAKLRYNQMLPVLLVIGIFFLFSGTLLSNSKIFQYSIGSMLFILLGFIWMIIQLYKFINKRYLKNDSKISWPLLSFVYTSYGAAIIYFIKENLKSILIHYWEFTLLYISFFGLLGIGATRWMRSYDESKHILMVTVRWIVRLIGLILIYNSTASPMISILYITSFVIIYMIRTFFKFVGSKKSKK